MKLEADDVLAIRAVDPPGLRRMMQISFAAHVVVTLAVLLGPSDWFRREPVEPIRMTISLGDGTGARLSGRTPAPGRTVARVEPARPRETVRPAASPQQTMAVPETVTRTPPPKPPETKAPPGPLPRPPAAGQQVQRGRAMTETGNVGESTGLASGGEQGGARTDLGADFCCPEWVGAMTSKIDGNWHPPAGMTGLVIIGFTVSQNGAITNVKVAQSSGNGLLDRVAQFALLETMKTGLPPLPAAYTEPTLTVRLSFPYGAR
jgi:TonB family protein